MNKETVFLPEALLDHQFPREWLGKSLKPYNRETCSIKITGETFEDLWEHCENLYRKMKRPDHRFIEGFRPLGRDVRVIFGS